MVSRRRFIHLSTLAAGSALSTSFLPSSDSSYDISVEYREIRIPELPLEFSDYRIGFLSDLHLGSFMPHDSIMRAVTLLNNESVDLVVLGGDYIAFRDSLESRTNGMSLTTCFDNCPAELLSNRLMSEVADLLAALRSRDGVYSVFGNHDRYTSAEFRNGIFRDYGIRNIENSFISLQRGSANLRLIGVEDLMYGRPELPTLENRKTKNEVRVLLSHNPDYLSHILRKTSFEFDLGLAGHTHGGQIKIPLLGALKYNVEDQQLREGLSERYGTAVYTTRGVGVVNLPLRVNCPAEVSVLSLVPA